MAASGRRPVLGVDTSVWLEGSLYGKPADATDAERMLERLAGKTHTVVSGLCLRTPGWEVVEHESTLVTFRELTPRELAHHLAHGEWVGRAGASRSRAAAPRSWSGSRATTSCRRPAGGVARELLAERFPGAYGLG